MDIEGKQNSFVCIVVGIHNSSMLAFIRRLQTVLVTVQNNIIQTFEVSHRLFTVLLVCLAHFVNTDVET